MKKLAIIILLVCVLLAVPGVLFHRNKQINVVHGKQAEFTLKMNNSSVQMGDTITLMIKIDSSIPMGKAEAYISYDPEIIEYVKSSSPYIHGTSGELYLNEMYAEPKEDMTYTVSMKALQTGTTNLKVTDCYIEDSAYVNVISVNAGQASVTVNKNKERSNDTMLRELLVFPGELDQAFQPDRYEYSVTVKNSVQELILSAIPENETAVVTVEQPEKLAVGKNTIKITVTATSGNTKTYSVIVTRKA